MKKRWLFFSLGLGLLLWAFPAAADQWDVATVNDDSHYTNNELIHGSVQVHDLGVRPGPVADEDWYVIAVQPYTSWEVLVDGNTGDLGFQYTLKRYGPDGATFLQDGAWTGQSVGTARWLAWEATASAQALAFARVGDPWCGTSCTSDDQYRIQLSETTIAIPRYNNSAGQVTVLLCQNSWWWDTAHGHVYLWVEGSGGVNATPSASFSFSIPGHGMQSWNLSTVLPNTRGAITVTHDSRAGAVVCKTVALEPATGFSFDSPGLTKPR